MGRRQPWAALSLAPGETGGAGRGNGTNKGGRGEIHTRRSPRPGPASSGVAAHASRRVRPLPRPTPAQKRGPSPDTPWVMNVVLCPKPGKVAVRSCQLEDRENPHHTVWRCEGRGSECRGGTTKDLAASAGKTEKKKLNK